MDLKDTLEACLHGILIGGTLLLIPVLGYLLFEVLIPSKFPPKQPIVYTMKTVVDGTPCVIAAYNSNVVMSCDWNPTE